MLRPARARRSLPPSSPSNVSWMNSPAAAGGADPAGLPPRPLRDPPAPPPSLTAAAPSRRAGTRKSPAARAGGRGLGVPRYIEQRRLLSPPWSASRSRRPSASSASTAPSMPGRRCALATALSTRSEGAPPVPGHQLDPDGKEARWGPRDGFRGPGLVRTIRSSASATMPRYRDEVLRSDAPPLGAGECSAGSVGGRAHRQCPWAHALACAARRLCRSLARQDHGGDRRGSPERRAGGDGKAEPQSRTDPGGQGRPDGSIPRPRRPAA